MIVADLANHTEEEIRDIVNLAKLIPESEGGLFKVKPFTELTYGEVIKLKGLAEAAGGVDDTVLKEVARLNDAKISDDRILLSGLKQYFKTVHNIERKFLKIKEYEDMLQGSTDDKLVSAGADRLNQFGDLNTIDALAGGDILKWEKILLLDWWDVFNKLYKTKIENDIRSNLELQREMESKNK